MIKQERPNFVASKTAPSPYEVTYWIDLTADPHGQVIKCYADGKWAQITKEDSSQQQADITALENKCTTLESTKVDKTVYDKFAKETKDYAAQLNLYKANKTNSLAGYGIENAYTKTETDAKALEIAQAECAKFVDSAPEALDTLSELAAALGNDPEFATTVATQIGTKANSADVYTKSACDTAISNAISAANKVTSTDITSMKVVSELPTIQETGVLYIKVSN